MKLEYVQVTNYKSFRESGQITVGQKFTVLVGQNNSGKTAFLEAVSIWSYPSKPFRQPEPAPGTFPPVLNPQSTVTFGILTTGRELKWRLLDTGGSFRLPVRTGAEEAQNIEVASFFDKQQIEIEARFVPGVSWLSSLPNATQDVEVRASPDRQDIHIASRNGAGADTIVQSLIGPYLQSALYVFRAERMNVGECSIEGGIDLRPDASNLASVLLHLDANPTALESFTAHLRTIFPTIYSAISRPKPSAPNTAMIEVINRDDQKSNWHPGISLPLADCGTGISQVMAILYVVATARTPRIIIIDEPNSFLHPGAARKLLGILKELDHQYIITTHSSEIIRAAEPDALHLVRWTGRESVVETLNRNDVNAIRRLLQELGVRLSDVFGADNVLWVEGPTEATCFPLLLKHAGHPLSAATAVVAMVNTGDLESRRTRRSLAWEVYERLSIGSALIPPAIAFSFDREGRTPTEIEDMQRRSRGRAHFIARLAYENYLLDAEAISGVLQSGGLARSPAEVQHWIAQHGLERKYFGNEVVADISDARWLDVVNAPKLLSDLFDELSVSAPISYDKRVHSVALTEWLLKHKPAQLDDLLQYVVSLVSSNQTGTLTR